MEATKTAVLADDIAALGEQLSRDLEFSQSKKPAFSDIRELRRLLNTLEGELRDEARNTRGDAC